MLNVVIPAAGCGRRMKSYGPKALVSLGEYTVIGRQLRLIKAAYPQANIVVVGGFEHDRLRRGLPNDVQVVVNDEYESSNVAYSVGLGLNACGDGPTLLVFGDLVFNSSTIENLDTEHSSVIIDPFSVGRNDEVGVNVVDGKVSNFSYGLPVKWGHIAVLTRLDQIRFMRIAGKRDSRRLFVFEIFNKLIDTGTNFSVVSPPGMNLVEIDTSRDIQRARLVH